jgi:uncharacterized protein YndB with AHSA1/START domain
MDCAGMHIIHNERGLAVRIVGLDQGVTMEKNLIAEASVTVHAPKSKVWTALVDPEAIKHYMFGTNVVTDWKAGSPIRWKGEWQGKAYEDKGEILKIHPGRVLQYTHFSPLSGQPDTPENYHTVTIDLAGEGGQTTVTLTQDNNKTEEDRKHSEKNWQGMLTSLKKFMEESA